MGCYKLAFVIERYFKFGGLQRDMRRFAVACAKKGHDVTIFTGHWDGPPEPAVKIESVNFKSLTNHGTIKKIEEFVETPARRTVSLARQRPGGIVFFGDGHRADTRRCRTVHAHVRRKTTTANAKRRRGILESGISPGRADVRASVQKRTQGKVLK